MPKKSATTSKTAAPATTGSILSANVISVTAATPAPAEKKSKKTTDATASVEASAINVVIDASTSASASSDAVDTSFFELTTAFSTKIAQMCSAITGLKSEFKNIEKRWARELKTAQKKSSKRKRSGEPRAPSGFVKATKISDELASFLGKESGSLMARTEVTREINKYIREHSLQDKTNGRKIIPDSKLSVLLKIGEEQELTYFNLQRFMSPHFEKSVKAVAAAAAAAAAASAPASVV